MQSYYILLTNVNVYHCFQQVLSCLNKILQSPTSSGCSIDMLAADESYSEYSSGSSSPPCDLSVIERLHRTHPVWFLPGIQRAGAVHLLQSKEEGVSLRFIILR